MCQSFVVHPLYTAQHDVVRGFLRLRRSASRTFGVDGRVWAREEEIPRRVWGVGGQRGGLCWPTQLASGERSQSFHHSIDFFLGVVVDKSDSEETARLEGSESVHHIDRVVVA